MTLISYKIITPKYKITQENILIFTQNLKTLLDSGLTISLVLDILSTQEKDIQFSKVIKNIRDKILMEIVSILLFMTIILYLGIHI